MATESEIVRKLFFRYSDAMRARSQKWTIPGEGKWGDRRIQNYIKYFFLPVREDEVIAFMDTTVLRTGREGILVTDSGIVIKEIAAKLYYLKFDKIASAEVREKTDDYYRTETSVWVLFQDGTEKQIFDFYIKGNFFVDFINDVVAKKEYKDDEEPPESGFGSGKKAGKGEGYKTSIPPYLRIFSTLQLPSPNTLSSAAR